MTFNKKILHALILMSALFLSLAIYLTYFQVFKGSELANSGNNPRAMIKENEIKRGTIYDRNGETLAVSDMTESGQTRKYPFNSLYSHVIGYNSGTYGRTMLENSFNNYLLGGDIVGAVINMRERLSGGDKIGADLTLTISHKLQKKASDLLGSNKGAVVAIAPKTGEVLALVSKPDFNPNEASLKEKWDVLINSPKSELLPRATMGLYPPGSSFKPIIAAAAIENNLDSEKFLDEGSITIGGQVIKNYNEKVYGEIDLKKALAVSSNTVFASLADKLGANNIKTAAEGFMFNKNIDFDLAVSESSSLKSNTGVTAVAASGIGQGDTLATPFNMALVASGIANDGVIMRPYLVQRAKLQDGAVVFRARTSQLSRATSSFVADKVEEMMIECIKSGTGRSAAIGGVTMAGKTGTAENETGADHAWFIAYAPANDPQIAVAVLVESAGKTGSEACAPIVRELIRTWLTN